MSGGLAFVLNAGGEFEARCNPAMVDLEALDLADRELLHDLVTRHVAATGSHLGARLLFDWQTAWPLFVKVMPRDYKRAITIAAPLVKVAAHG
jgi:glutamate synthase domain-containing protein 3